MVELRDIISLLSFKINLNKDISVPVFLSKKTSGFDLIACLLDFFLEFDLELHEEP